MAGAISPDLLINLFLTLLGYVSSPGESGHFFVQGDVSEFNILINQTAPPISSVPDTSPVRHTPCTPALSTSTADTVGQGIWLG